MRDDYDILLGRNNITLLQQIIGADTATMSEEELVYYNPSMDIEELERSIDDLTERGYLKRITINRKKDLPHEFLSATQKAKSDLQEVGLWDDIEMFHQFIGLVDKTERIRRIEEIKPRGELSYD